MSRSNRGQQNVPMRNRDVWDTVEVANITNIRPFVGQMLYEGCHQVYADRRMCELGKSARRAGRGRAMVVCLM